MAIAEIASANTIAMIIAVNILGVAEGLRPSAVMLAKALAMMTEIGPRIHRLKINTKATLRDIKFKLRLLKNLFLNANFHKSNANSRELSPIYSR